MSKIIVVSDRDGNVLGLARYPLDGPVGITARPAEGQHVDHLHLPAELEKYELHELHRAVRVDRSAAAPALVRRADHDRDRDEHEREGRDRS